MAKRFSVHQFDNGLTVVMEFMPETVSTAVGFLIKTGARDESIKLDGVSHFLEHMMFKGTTKRGWQEINRDFDQMGARYNAFTSWEETCYYAWVLNEEVPKALELLSDMLTPALPDDEFTTEKKVILEEIARYDDMPEHVAFDAAMKIAYARHRLSSNILGTPRSIKKLKRDEMHAYFNQRYVPSNITLFACGNVDEAKLLADVEKLWGTRAGKRADRVSKAPTFNCGSRMVYKKGVTRQHIVLMWPAVPVGDRRSIAASLLGAILGDDRNSRIYWALRHTGLAEEAGAGYWGFTDAGMIAAHASCDPGKTEKVAGLLRSETAKLKKGIREQELQRVKNRARTSLVFSAETPFNRFRQLMQQWAIHRELLTPEEMLERIEDVKLDDLHMLLRDFPLDTDGVMVGLGPKPAAPAKTRIIADSRLKTRLKIAARKSTAKRLNVRH